MNRKDVISGFGLLSFSVVICYQASRYPFGTLGKIGPGFLPFYLGLALIGLSLMILIRALVKPPKEDSATRVILMKRQALPVLSVFLLTVTYTFLMGRMGFPLSTFLFILVLFKFVESNGWVFSILGALVISIVSFLVFGVWLQCQFPPGWFRI